MVLAAGAIAAASADEREQERWDATTAREVERYGVDATFARTRALGEEPTAIAPRRSPVDWAIVALATATFIALAAFAQAPPLAIHAGWLAVVIAASIAILGAWGVALWQTTRFT